MTTGTPPTDTGIRTRGLNLMLALVAAASVVGFMAAINERAVTTQPDNGHQEAHGDAPPALTYRELATRNLSPNAAWTNPLSKLDQSAHDPSPDRSLAALVAAIEDRGRNRAYDGAPPTIPHAVNSRSATSCLACHRDGLFVDGRSAPRVSHAEMTNCLQCHVENLDHNSAATAANDFVGAHSGSGQRYWSDAPPTLPHTTWMREDCLSCHGPHGRPGLRTTHPERQNCLQCHAPSATLDQRPPAP